VENYQTFISKGPLLKKLDFTNSSCNILSHSTCEYKNVKCKFL